MKPLDGVVRLVWRVHRWVYSRTGGRIGGRLLSMPVLLLTTIGRRSGRAHTTALTYLADSGRYIVIGSNGGARRHPDWYLNLRAHPKATIQTGSALVKVTARRARDRERDRLWARAVAAYRGYAGYQHRTTRTIPVVVLEPKTRPEEGVR